MDAQDSMTSMSVVHQCVDRPQAPLLKADMRAQISPFIRCTKRRVTKSGFEEYGMVGDKWGSLDPNILREIFSRIPVLDLFFTVSVVCQSWEAECWDFLFWNHKVLDISVTGVGLGMVDISEIALFPTDQSNRVPGFFGVLDSPDSYLKMATTLMKKLRRIMDGSGLYKSSQTWSGKIETIVLPYDLEISDTHLLYIAERTPSVQRLLLLCPSKLTVSGFTKAMENWKQVKEIHLGQLRSDAFTRFIGVIAKRCEKLESLHIHQEHLIVDQPHAFLIAKNFPGLKKLEFDLAIIQPGAVITLYNMCMQLEEIYFNGCQRVWDDDVSRHHIPACEYFLLSWTVREGGYTKWNVKLCPVSIERLMGLPGVFSKEELAKRMASPEYLEGSRKTDLQHEVEYWMSCSHEVPRR